MKIETRKVYRCEHCNKWYISASACSVHERFCRKKPENKHKCFDFYEHLQMNNTYPKKEMICKLSGEYMYSYKWERRCHYHGNSPERKGIKRMPLECDKFKRLPIDMDGYYINKQNE